MMHSKQPEDKQSPSSGAETHHKPSKPMGLHITGFDTDERLDTHVGLIASAEANDRSRADQILPAYGGKPTVRGRWMLMSPNSAKQSIDSPLSDLDIDFLDNAQVLREYYPHCEQAVRKATDAFVVAAFDHNVRSAAGKRSKQRIDRGQQVQGLAHVVHGDYTLTSAPQRFRDLTKPPKSNDTLGAILPEGQSLLDSDEIETALASGRYGIVNVWRNIANEPVAVNPLALCDAACVRPEDLVVFEIHYADRIGENYFARHGSEGHKTTARYSHIR